MDPLSCAQGLKDVAKGSECCANLKNLECSMGVSNIRTAMPYNVALKGNLTQLTPDHTVCFSRLC